MHTHAGPVYRPSLLGGQMGKYFVSSTFPTTARYTEQCLEGPYYFSVACPGRMRTELQEVFCRVEGQGRSDVLT
jgi:hypothetical protein